MNIKTSVRILLLVAVFLSAIPGRAQAAALPPPLDMFQLPWEQGRAWVAYDGLDNGAKRPSNSPHNYKQGGAIDFAPRVNMVIGEDTSNDWVAAAAAGTVTQVGSCYVKIDHGNGWLTEYWHLDKIQVKAGDLVSRNQRLAIIHNNKKQQVCLGNEYPGPHLHFIFRPKVMDTLYAGWMVNYNSFTNKTTYTKNGQTVGSLQPLMNTPNLQVVSRGFISWDTQYTGSVDAYRHERWSLVIIDETTFEVNVTPKSVGLVPVIVLLDADGNEIERASGKLRTTQPTGFYYVQIQSEEGTGFYGMIATKEEGGTATVTPSGTETPATGIPDGTGTPGPTGTPDGNETPFVTETPTPTPFPTETTGTPEETFTATPTPYATYTPFETNTPDGSETSTPTPVESGTATPTPLPYETPVVTGTPVPTFPAGPYVFTDVIQSSLLIGESSLVQVGLNNVPSAGYSSAEFICTYDPSVVEVSNIAAAGLFGADPVSAMSGPQNGQFILAIAGSNGKRATTGGVAFNFDLRGLQAGWTNVLCAARVSAGQGSLTTITPVPDQVTVVAFMPSPTATLPASATLSGQVHASKPVTIQLLDANSWVLVSQSANPDGSFSFPFEEGTYTIIASAPGFLSAQGFVTLTNGATTSMPIIELPAGDVDGNSVIDQFDALTIGVNYNASSPSVADLNNDGVINILDLEMLAANYRKAGALTWQ
ncbi:MAG: peptidoglycan DD-metalloendopeptidase family protein [Anaerolineales bacterium]|nr:peptidoglycan DD-metalloendopeptidase family protein [Anaerolineales bacterium]